MELLFGVSIHYQGCRTTAWWGYSFSEQHPSAIDPVGTQLPIAKGLGQRVRMISRSADEVCLLIKIPRSEPSDPTFKSKPGPSHLTSVAESYCQQYWHHFPADIGRVRLYWPFHLKLFTNLVTPGAVATQPTGLQMQFEEVESVCAVRVIAEELIPRHCCGCM